MHCRRSPFCWMQDLMHSISTQEHYSIACCSIEIPNCNRDEQTVGSRPVLSGCFRSGPGDMSVGQYMREFRFLGAAHTHSKRDFGQRPLTRNLLSDDFVTLGPAIRLLGTRTQDPASNAFWGNNSLAWLSEI